MFRIRKFFDSVNKTDRNRISQIKIILKEQFPLISDKYFDDFEKTLNDPVNARYQTKIFIADNGSSRVKGFGIVLHFSDLNFYYLDYIASDSRLTGRGIGGALYQRIREEAFEAGAFGIFMECLPDVPDLCRDPEILKQNISRLRFYERFDTRPIINTRYETPVNPDDDNPPFLLFDHLGKNSKLEQEYLKKVIKAILERKYYYLIDRNYIQMVVDSVKDNPVKIRPPKYIRKEMPSTLEIRIHDDEKIPFIVNQEHALHHIHEKGYVETPVRIQSILKVLSTDELFSEQKTSIFPESCIISVHSAEYINYLKKVCASDEAKTNIYPYVFPLRNRAVPPKELPVRAGYYCMDTFTPINRNVYRVARQSVNCALTGANLLTKGFRLTYALVRPPGHHAETSVFGGFCYLNSAAVAADFLSAKGKVFILDLDFHHGNGQQEIFYSRDDVLTISIHGHPSFAYPYFSGFSEENGTGKGIGFNINFPLNENTSFESYLKKLEKAIQIIKKFEPDYGIICFGADTSKGDPTGTWNFQKEDYEKMGCEIGKISTPLLVVQEGGYSTRKIGKIVHSFLRSMWKSVYKKERFR